MDMYGSCRICCRIVEWQPVWLVTGSINLQMRPWCFGGFLAGSFSWCYTPGRLLLPLHLLESNCYTVALAQTDSICQHLVRYLCVELVCSVSVTTTLLPSSPENGSPTRTPTMSLLQFISSMSTWIVSNVPGALRIFYISPSQIMGRLQEHRPKNHLRRESEENFAQTQKKRQIRFEFLRWNEYKESKNIEKII